MIQASEHHYLVDLKLNHSLDRAAIYKACVALACEGLTLPDEQSLSQDERTLLEVRRRLSTSDIVGAKSLLMNFESADNLLKGDYFFLFGQICHRSGEQNETSVYMNLAADQYRLIGDYHRELRARVNGALCVANLASCLVGDLSILEMEARRKNFSDIAANICRTRAIELLRAGRLSEAHAQAMEASALYQLDGYVHDRAVALAIAAIVQFCLGNTKLANELRSQMLILEGKVATYLLVYEQLVLGKTPKVPPGHPLAEIVWSKIVLKTESISGRIITALRDGPKTKHELVELIWNSHALNESYDRRLYSAINELRTEKSFSIGFDGSRYYLP